MLGYSKSSFKFMGYENPSGSYPASVLPIIEKDGGYFAVYLELYKEAKFVGLTEKILEEKKGITFNPYKDELNYLSDFNPLEERLFALSTNLILRYKVNEAAIFYKKLIRDHDLSQRHPFVALSLAKRTPYRSLIFESIAKCGQSFKRSNVAKNKWYLSVRNELSPRYKELPIDFDTFIANYKKKTENTPVDMEEEPLTRLTIKTFIPKLNGIKNNWYYVDVSNLILGRVASKIALYLQGKHKPEYTPGMNCGDYVVVVNASNVSLTGKKIKQKKYYKHSGFIGGIKTKTLEQMLLDTPEKVIYLAVKGMLPKNKLGRKQLKKLKIFNSIVHTHMAQKPIDITQLFNKTNGAHVLYPR